jgi:hypothetical protein
MQTTSIISAAQQAGTRYQQLVICASVSPNETSNLFETVAEETGWSLLNINLELSQALLGLSAQERKQQVVRLFEDLIRTSQAKTLLLDHIELLFERSLGLNPITVLGSVARHCTLIVNWPGTKTGSTLSYASPNHPETCSYKLAQLGDVIFVDDNS